MQGHQARGHLYYRCRYTAEYAKSAELDHPKNVYLRQDDLLPHIDVWLTELFSPDRLDETVRMLLEAAPESSGLRKRRRIEQQLRDADSKIRNYRTLLDEGTEPALVAGWINEVSATKQTLERQLAELSSDSPDVDRDWLLATIAELGDMSAILEKGDQRDRAGFYEAVGLTGVYQCGDNQVVLTTNPVGHMVRVGGGT